MRKSLILFALLFAYIWGCASSTEEDKYPLVTKSDRKKIKTICKCIEPLSPMLIKMMEAKDSAIASMYEDSLEIKAAQMGECFEKLNSIDFKPKTDNEKYLKQFIEYVKETHPDCVPFFLGVKDSNEEKIKK
jgi:hypothetical protein